MAMLNQVDSADWVLYIMGGEYYGIRSDDPSKHYLKKDDVFGYWKLNPEGRRIFYDLPFWKFRNLGAEDIEYTLYELTPKILESIMDEKIIRKKKPDYDFKEELL